MLIFIIDHIYWQFVFIQVQENIIMNYNIDNYQTNLLQ